MSDKRIRIAHDNALFTCGVDLERRARAFARFLHRIFRAHASPMSGASVAAAAAKSDSPPRGQLTLWARTQAQARDRRIRFCVLR